MIIKDLVRGVCGNYAETGSIRAVIKSNQSFTFHLGNFSDFRTVRYRGTAIKNLCSFVLGIECFINYVSLNLVISH